MDFNCIQENHVTPFLEQKFSESKLRRRKSKLFLLYIYIYIYIYMYLYICMGISFGILAGTLILFEL